MTEPLDEVQALEAAGLFLSAYDRAVAALGAGADDDRLRHRAVLALARGGAIRPALALFRRFGLRGNRVTDIAALEGRLLKDLALRAGPARIQPLAARAAAAYTRVWRRDPAAPYPAINAASMSLLAGDRDGALEIARRVRLLQRDDGGYWAAATMAEASVLLGDADTARRHLEVAQARAGDDFAARATTRRQLRLVTAIMGIDPRIIDTLRVPKTIHYCGHMPEAAPAPDAARHELALVARIDRALAELDVRFAYGALAAGADILFVEALLRRGVRPTIVLPFDRDTFVRESVLPYGAAWVARFERCVAKCDVPEPEGARYRHDELDFGHGSRRAMGLARMHARRIDGAVAQVAAWDGVASAWEAGTASDVARWAAAGGRTLNLGCGWRRPAVPPPSTSDPSRRRWMGVLFGDLPRFSTLDDDGLRRFYGGPLAAMGGVVDRHAPRYRNAWGDAVQLAFDSSRQAAACALGLREAVTAASLTAAGLPPALVPRLALDHGPVLAVADAVQRAHKFAGRVMTRAARIEPVTPPGQIYATESFACEVALDPGAVCECDYAGRVPTAKEFGVLPLYAVHPPRLSSAEIEAALRAPDAAPSAAGAKP